MWKVITLATCYARTPFMSVASKVSAGYTCKPLLTLLAASPLVNYIPVSALKQQQMPSITSFCVESILTDNDTEFKGRPTIHLYAIFLELNDLNPRKKKVVSPRTNGFVEKFNRTILDEFFRTAFRRRLYEFVSTLQEDLDKWLHYYNYERPHRGYRNQERCPFETFQMGIEIKSEMEKETA